MIFMVVISLFLFIAGVIVSMRDFTKLTDYGANRRMSNIIALMLASAGLAQIAWSCR